jgi:G6PDH family F420-dependent oxidoreductase
VSRFGFKLMCEIRSGRELVAQAELAEENGFEFVAISDHIHPWLPEHEHSPFAWSVLGAVAARTSRLDLATGVTCPTVRYHPAIVAQAAATVASMTDRKFTLALGAGERLNEHVTGALFPAVDQRHRMLTEAAGIIRQLLTGEWTTARGEFFTVEDTRVYERPTQPVDLVIAVSGNASLDVAAGLPADGIMATEANAALVDGWEARRGSRSATWTEIPFAWGPDADDAQRVAHERFRFAMAGWKVMSELPSPVNFGAACETVRPEDVGARIPHGPDPKPYIDAVNAYRDAGFEHISIIPVTDDIEGLVDFWNREVRPALGESSGTHPI